ncbi:transposase [Micromonospora orduensis]|uniref:Transposase n=1 Tax=Micromonospora orduensis TaxID=1420891 RepID=A0A5C4QGG9_9ACTN|nr:transposase [Micromonospora orduensis]
MGDWDGQTGDNPQLLALLDRVSVKRTGPGRPRERPDCVLADRAYSAPATRRALRKRGIRLVSPEKRDHAAHRRDRALAPMIHRHGLASRSPARRGRRPAPGRRRRSVRRPSSW